MSKTDFAEIPEDLRNNILNFWKTERENTVKNIADAFQVKEGLVNSVLNRYLKNLTK